MHSRSPRWMMLPCSSARTWNSMCLGWGRYFSIKTSSSPKAWRARVWADSSAESSSSSRSITLIPIPPPPKAGLRITGYPMDLEDRAAWARSLIFPRVPGTTGMPARAMIWRVMILFPDQLQGPARRADELDPLLFAGPGEVRVFGKESVAGMNGLRLRFLGQGHDLGGYSGSFPRPAKARGSKIHRHSWQKSASRSTSE